MSYFVCRLRRPTLTLTLVAVKPACDGTRPERRHRGLPLVDENVTFATH